MVKFIFSKRSKKRLFIEVSLALIVIIAISMFLYLRYAYGVTRTWDGEGTTNDWSECANWSANTCPGSGDIAAFDNTSDKDATVDASFGGSVAGVDINSGYDGTITVARSLTVGASHFDQASGTWNGADQNLNINNGNFTLSGGIHTATTGTWTVERNFTHSGGTLTASGTTVTLDDDLDSSDDSTFTCSGTYSGTLSIQKEFGDFTLVSGCTVTSIGTFYVENADVVINGSASGATNINIDRNLTIGASGSLSYSGTLSFIDGLDSSDDSTFTCTGTHSGTIAIQKDFGDFTLASGCTVTSIGTFTSGDGAIFINGSASGATSINIDRNITIAASGSLSYSGTMSFVDGLDSSDDTTFSCTGTHSDTIAVQKDFGDFTLAAGCSATDVGTFIVSEGATVINGALSGATNLTVEGNFTIGSAGSLSHSGTLTFTDSGSADDTTFTVTGSLTGNVTLNKDVAGATFTLGGDSTITGNFTRTDGEIINPASAYTLGISGNISISTSDTFGGANLTFELNGTGTQNITQNAGTFSSPLIIDKTAGSAVLLTALTLGDDLTITDGNFQNDSFALNVTDVLTVNDAFTQGAGHLTVVTLTVGANGSYSNSSTGNLILGAGGVGNSGEITIGDFATCPTTDGRAITSSSPGNQRSWTGSGTTNVYDTQVTDQGGTATVNAYSSTSISGNGGGWAFHNDTCELPINPRIQGGSRLRGGTKLN